jgi:ATP-binding cassette, subfamily B, bacterial
MPQRTPFLLHTGNRTLDRMLQNLSRQVAYLPQTFRLIWAASRCWTMIWIALLVIQGGLPASTVYLTRLLVDSLVSVVGAGITWNSIQIILLPAGLMIVVLILSEFLQGAIEWIRTAQSELVKDHISGLVHQQSMDIDYSCYESSEYNDYLNRARDGASDRSLALLENTGSLLQNSITLLAMAAILSPYGVWMPIALVVSALPAFHTTLRLNLQQYEWSQRTTSDRRRLQYYDLVLTSDWMAAELRLFDFGDYFKTAYRQLRDRLRQEQLQLIKEQSLARLGAGLVAFVIAGVALLWMGQQVLLGLITLGDLALFYQAFNRGQGIVKALLGSLGQIYKNSLFMSDLFAFLNLKPQIADPAHPLPTRYPGSEEAILENFNLTIPSNQIVAIVGDNGAGKSTLTKLICRLYDPESGSVELDGIDLRAFRVKGLRKLITVLFQFPIPYYVSAAQNIALGDLAATPSPAMIEKAAKGAGIHDKITRLPQGYDTMMGKWFADGCDLSGGEWQRLALARAFLRPAEIILLDEPTSAMDPWAEFDWLERFRSMANGRTAIVITHRFTLAMRADIIHVMRAGKIVESGSHTQLLDQGGFYAKSWQEQMQSPSATTIPQYSPSFS